MAAWRDAELVWARGVKEQPDLTLNRRWRGMVDAVVSALVGAFTIAIELPQVYDRSRSKGDPNDLVQLAAVVGGIVDRMVVPATIYLPREWKKQVPKKIMCERVEGRLTPEERARVELPNNKKLQLDVWDAVGIGLHHLGRL